MWLWYNTQLIRDKDLVLSTGNRAFQYGDGIFETIIVKDKVIQHAEYHEKRMLLGARALSIDLDLSFEEFSKRILFLMKKNKLQDGRVKITIWRREGGFYIPETNEAEYLITIKSKTETNTSPQRLALAKTVNLSRSMAPNCKTLNSLPYVLAGLELKNMAGQVDDLIIPDSEGHISECISSNLFWVKDGIYYTPSLETNCVAGVKRAYIIDRLKERQIAVHEVKAEIEQLYNADAVFKTNVTGIFPVVSVEGRRIVWKDYPLFFD